MKTIKERILTIALISSFALCFLGYFLIRGALHSFDNYVSYIMLAIGVVCVLLFAIVLLIALRYSKKKRQVLEQEKLGIMQYGTPFKIDLDSIQIKSNKWNSSRFIENHFYDIEIKEENIQTILEVEIELDGEKKQFHWPSHLEPKSLEMYFAFQKETTLYIDPANQSNFYLDLRFIH
jgi:Ca2+/Na+ antiporter